LPLVLSLVSYLLARQSLDVVRIANQQQGGILNWNIFGGGALSGVDKFIALESWGIKVTLAPILCSVLS